MKPSGTLSGKTVLITGANTGLGLELSVLAARDGARVVMACRNPVKASRARETVLARCSGTPIVTTATLDLASLASVKSFRARYPESKLDVLVCNAGIMMVPFGLSEDGVESQFATNVLGHYALLAGLADLLAPAGRVVMVSSVMSNHAKKLRLDKLSQEKSYDATRVYCETKLCNLLMTRKLNRWARETGAGLRAVSAHPGYSSTELQRSVTGGQIANFFFAQSASQGVLPLYVAASQPDVRADAYCGPDGWFEMRGQPKWDCYENPLATDETLQDRLWSACERLSGIAFPKAPASSRL